MARNLSFGQGVLEESSRCLRVRASESTRAVVLTLCRIVISKPSVTRSPLTKCSPEFASPNKNERHEAFLRAAR
jgi:hypothetical protein